MKKLSGTNIAEIIAILLSIIILIALAIIPQFFSKKILQEIISAVDYATANINDEQVVSESLKAIRKQLDDSSNFLHFLYPHSYVTTLELAVSVAYKVSIAVPDERGQILAELSAIKSVAEVLLETDCLSLNSIL